MSEAWVFPPSGLVAPLDEVHVWRLEVETADARPALRRILGRYLGESPDAIELWAGEHGKPALCGHPPALHFNLSHSGALALVAVSATCEVGIDVEAEDPDRDFARLAELGLDRKSCAAVLAAPADRRAAVFYTGWTHREATVKCLGIGLAKPLPRRPVSIRGLDVGDGYAAALAVAGERKLPLRRFAVPRC